ncbi:Zn-dependent exopeptidase [Athelia psychrophila]|uniref:Peptide hydrolase n=1 Tax=Athelia psychrophila TaxID=1759441 RepID=A0A166CNR5_9AGAM|nr:Zn-dependent exopeptidase [Fibularhizoctonia sp. CBS 109695]
MSIFSAQEQQGLMLKLLEQHDIVDVMHMTGHGDGLDEVRLLEVDGERELRLMTEGDKLRLKKDGHSFVDVTDHLGLGQLNAQRGRIASIPTGSLRTADVASRRWHAVASMLKDLDDSHLKKDIVKLTSFWNRSHRSRWGLLSSNWIHDQAESILRDGYSLDSAAKTSVKKFHHLFLQNSIIARIESSDDSVKPDDKGIIIISAHQDSLNYALPFYRAPGADDDGSGTVTILQVLRSLAAVSFTPPPNTGLEVHWYAGEEAGLLGSQDVAAAYEKADASVKGVLHMDMTAFVRNGTTPIVAFFGQHTNPNLTAFATRVVDEYLNVGWNMTEFPNPRAGSDHMSWTKAGYPAAFAAEGLFENFAPNVHTVYDAIENGGQYSFEHMLEFVKLGIAFVVELSAAA